MKPAKIQTSAVAYDGDPWPFALGAAVQLTWNGRIGRVLGRGEYVPDECEFFVEYVHDDGILRGNWLHEELLDRVEPQPALVPAEPIALGGLGAPARLAPDSGAS